MSFRVTLSRFSVRFLLGFIALSTISGQRANAAGGSVFKLSELQPYGIRAVCSVRSNYRGTLGTMRGKKFARGIRRPRRSRKGFASAYRQAVRSCRALSKQLKSAGIPISTAGSSNMSTGTNNESGSKKNGGESGGQEKPSVRLPAIPALAEWKANMQKYGSQHCNFMKSGSGTWDEQLLSTYYDAEWIFYQIADYTGDSGWLSCADAAERIYRDKNVLASNGKVPGYWNFSHGETVDFLRTGDPSSKQAVSLLARNAAFAPDDTPVAWTASSEASREVAYTIMAYLNAERIGEARRARLGVLVDQALSHLDQWTVSQTAPYVRPFMVALTSQALITYHEQVGDSRVIPALTKALDWIWDHTWISSQGTFMYTDRSTGGGGTEPAPDLNLLIAPAYAWLYRQTGEQRFLERGDQVFAGGIKAAFLTSAKQFNQNYRWSIQFVRWRSEN